MLRGAPIDAVSVLSDTYDDSARYTEWLGMVVDVVVGLQDLRDRAEGGEDIELELSVRPPRLSPDRVWATTPRFIAHLRPSRRR